MTRRAPRVTGIGGLLFTLCALGTAPANAASLGISLAAPSLRFQASNPAVQPTVPALENPIAVSVNYSGTGNWVLNVLADGDLLSAGSSIPISRIRWTANGAAFSSGTLSKTSPQAVGTGNVSATGSLSFFLADSWNFAAGSYAQTITFTAVEF